MLNNYFKMSEAFSKCLVCGSSAFANKCFLINRCYIKNEESVLLVDTKEIIIVINAFKGTIYLENI